MLLLLKRTLAAALWCFFGFATILSFMSNANPKWFDYASAAPFFIVMIALAFGRERLLFDELNGWLLKLGHRENATAEEKTPSS